MFYAAQYNGCYDEKNPLHIQIDSASVYDPVKGNGETNKKNIKCFRSTYMNGTILMIFFRCPLLPTIISETFLLGTKKSGWKFY